MTDETPQYSTTDSNGNTTTGIPVGEASYDGDGTWTVTIGTPEFPGSWLDAYPISGDCSGASGDGITITVTGGECAPNSELDELSTNPGCGDLETTDCPPGEGCGGDGESGDDCDEESEDPVTYVGGHKIVRETDLRVALTGRDFVLTREYISDPDKFVIPDDATTGVASGEVGANWIFNTSSRLYAGASSNRIRLSGNPLRADRIYKREFTRWLPNGRRSKDYFETHQTTGDYVWRSRDGSYAYYGDGGVVVHRPTYESDAFGNERVYTYKDIYDDSTSNSSRKKRRRLSSVSLRLPGGTEVAKVDYYWHEWETGTAAVNPHLFARPIAVEVSRPDGSSGYIVTQRAEYRYFISGAGYTLDHDGDGTADEAVVFASDFGTDGDLCEVTVSTRVDHNYADSSDPWHHRVTQYRYHSGTPLAVDVSTSLDGDNHQLLAVFDAVHVEYYADVLGAATTQFTSVRDAAALLRGLSLTDTEGVTNFPVSDHWSEVWNLASKLVGYHQGSDNADKVSTQFVLGGCGCSGAAGQGQRFDYNYFEYEWTGVGDPLVDADRKGLTCQILESQFDGTDYEPYRIQYHDFSWLDRNGAPYRRARAVVEAAWNSGATNVLPANSNVWATVFDYNSLFPTNRLDRHYKTLLRKSTPSSSNYVALEDASWNHSGENTRDWSDVGIKNSIGLVHHYEYELLPPLQGNIKFPQAPGDELSEPWVNKVMVSQGWLGSRQTIEEYERHSDDRPDLIVNRKEHTTSSEQTDWQVDYAFDPSNFYALRVRTQRVQEDKAAENGPDVDGGTAEIARHELFDEFGRLRWIKHEDDVNEYREYDNATGRITKVVMNADATEVALAGGANPNNSNDFPGVPSGLSWVRVSGASMVQEMSYDDLGRLISSTNAAGVTRYTKREVRWADDDLTGVTRGVPHMATTSLPHRLSSGPNTYEGPAHIEWKDAAGRTIRVSEFVLQSSGWQPDTGPEPSYSFSTTDPEVARATTQLALSGVANSARVWHDVAGDGFYETQYEFDGLGRLTKTIDPEGGHVRRVYDILDRVVGVYQTREHGGPLQLVTEPERLVTQYTYDSAQSALPGVGNGNLTLEQHYTDLAGNQTREFKRWYDFRDRLTGVVGPEAPHQTFAYDNADRLVKQSSRTTDWSGPTAPAPTPGAGTNSSYVEYLYSDRGLPYKQKIAIDPTAGSPEYLETNRWFDERGRQVAVWAPNGPGTKTTYDAFGRVKFARVTSRKDDANPGATGNYADAISVTDDIVIEQAKYDYMVDGDNDTGLLELVTVFHRRHDYLDSQGTGGGLGKLDGGVIANRAFRTYSGMAYDDAGRMTDTLSFGTNTAGNVFDSDSSPPTLPYDTSRASNGVALIDSVEFDERGRVIASIDPEGTRTEIKLDDLSRRVAVVEAASGAIVLSGSGADISWKSSAGRWDVSWGSPVLSDADRVTSFAYDGLSNLVKRVAHINDGTSSGKVQETAYVYGTLTPGTSGALDSRVSSSGLLDRVHYPNEQTGSADTANEYTVRYAYNIQGELVGMKDQMGTVHVYERDGLGRVEHDRVTSVDGGLTHTVDTSIMRISASYDDHGRLDAVRSYDNAVVGTGSVKNSIGLSYSPLHQVEEVRQHPEGDISTANPPLLPEAAVSYTYDTAEMANGNYSRLETLRYPSDQNSDDPTLQVTYGATTGNTADLISRVTSLDKIIQQAGSGYTVGNAYVKYIYAGRRMTPRVRYDVGDDVRLELSRGADRIETPGIYAGMDRYGRIINQMWINNHFTDTVDPADPLVSRAYAYDRASNRLLDYDNRPNPAFPDRDWWYDYDELDRLKTAFRGEFTGTDADRDGWTGLNQTTREAKWSLEPGSEAWDLDILGNWDEFDRDEDDTSFPVDFGPGNGEEETRVHNMANELTSFQPQTSPVATQATTHQFDESGNLRRELRAGSTNGYKYTYDAWNRLVKIEYQSPTALHTIGEYEYNGLGWRTIRRSDTTKGSYDGVNEERRYFYSAGWQVLEEHIDEDGTGASLDAGDPADIDRRGQQVWGVRYIDDSVARRVDTDGDGTFEAEYKYLTDALFSVRAIVDSDGSCIEYLDYTPYGEDGAETVHRYAGDLDGDSVLTSADLTMLQDAINNSEYIADADLTHDGLLDFSDIIEMSGRIGAGYDLAMPGSWVGDPERASVASDNSVGFAGYWSDLEAGLCSVRFRNYSPSLGRWLQRDPVGYIDSSNGYLYVRSQPITNHDPFGLVALLSLYTSEPPDIYNDPDFLFDALERSGNRPGVVMTGSNFKPIVDKVRAMADYLDCLKKCIEDDPSRLLAITKNIGLNMATDYLAAAELLGHIPSAMLSLFEIDPETGQPELDEGELIGMSADAYADFLEIRRDAGGRAQRGIQGTFEMWLRNGANTPEDGQRIADKMAESANLWLKRDRAQKLARGIAGAARAGGRVSGVASAAMLVNDAINELVEVCADQCCLPGNAAGDGAP